MPCVVFKIDEKKKELVDEKIGNSAESYDDFWLPYWKVTAPSTDHLEVGLYQGEYFETGKATAKGDVYSFDVVMLVLLTGKKALEEGTRLVTWVLGDITILEITRNYVGEVFGMHSRGLPKR
uniref:Uncharacterized protein n=1 Tax=Chenopodium quinoa TaxID=63459 RepID=A0A803N8E7_CHEQI